ncbi:MAG: Holliday junction resolvase RuvX [Pyrinomonadaceae bacterium]
MINDDDFTALVALPDRGRIFALDPGTKRIGLAVCDELQMLSRALKILQRTSWKKLLVDVRSQLIDLDAVALVIGLPYNFDGTESEMSGEARNMAAKFQLSLAIPIFLQDERASSYEARGRMWAKGPKANKKMSYVDADAASIILADFLDRLSVARARTAAS